MMPDLTESLQLGTLNHAMAIDLTHIFTKYRGQWVGLQDDEQTVIASGSTVREVMDRARAKGVDRPILLHVPSKLVPYVGHHG